MWMLRLTCLQIRVYPASACIFPGLVAGFNVDYCCTSNLLSFFLCRTQKRPDSLRSPGNTSQVLRVNSVSFFVRYGPIRCLGRASVWLYSPCKACGIFVGVEARQMRVPWGPKCCVLQPRYMFPCIGSPVHSNTRGVAAAPRKQWVGAGAIQ